MKARVLRRLTLWGVCLGSGAVTLDLATAVGNISFNQVLFDFLIRLFNLLVVLFLGGEASRFQDGGV